MANLYARSTDGSDSDNGTTWTLAKATVEGAAGIDSAGDTIWVSQNHAETTGVASRTISIAGTHATPSRLLCGNDGAEPPTALATTGSISVTGSNNITITGCFYAYGLTFAASSGAGAGNVNLSNSSFNDVQVYEACKFRLNGSDSSSRLNISGGSTNGSELFRLLNCSIKFASTGQYIAVNSGRLEWREGGIESGSSAVLILCTHGGRAGDVLFENLDLTAGATSMAIFNPSGSSVLGGTARIRNCRLPASWSGTLWSTVPSQMGLRAEMINCDSGDTNFRLWVEDYAGSIKSETILVKSGGASDGTTPLAWKMASSANAEYPAILLVSPEFYVWNETTGSAITVTVDILRDSATALKDNEIWLEVQYLGTSGYPQGVSIDDAAADVITTGADQTSSSATWTTTGMSNPNKQQLSVTFTPREKGPLICRVCLAKASTTVYVDPKVTVS